MTKPKVEDILNPYGSGSLEPFTIVKRPETEGLDIRLPLCSLLTVPEEVKITGPPRQCIGETRLRGFWTHISVRHPFSTALILGVERVNV